MAEHLDADAPLTDADGDGRQLQHFVGAARPLAPTTNDLGRVITDPRAREAVYGAYVVLLVIAGAVTIGFATAGGIPLAVSVGNAVLGYLGIPVGGLAVLNVKRPA